MHFDSFRTEYIPQDVLNETKDISITCNRFRIKSGDFTICEFCRIAFMKYMIIGKTLLDHTSFCLMATKGMTE